MIRKILMIALFAFNFVIADDENSYVVDHDGNAYRVAKIGSQVWMAENLKVKIDSSSWCYINNPENCEKYGRLYDWATTMKLPEECNRPCSLSVQYPHQGICPDGWHVPTKEEYDTLIANVGGEAVAGKMLKAKKMWDENGYGIDKYEFSVISSGYKVHKELIDDFYSLGVMASFWTATKDGYSAYNIYFHHSLDQVLFFYRSLPRALSVRCLKN